MDGVASLAFRKTTILVQSSNTNRNGRKMSIEKNVAYELIVLGFDGHLKRFLLSSTKPIAESLEQNLTFDDSVFPSISLRNSFSSVSCMAWHPVKKLLVVGGDGSGDGKGIISMYIMKDSSPFHEIVYKSGKRGANQVHPGEQEEMEGKWKGMFKSIKYSLSKRGEDKSIISKLIFSPNDGENLLGMDISGNLFVWNTNLMVRTHFITSNGLKHSNETPFDASWWSDKKVIVVNRLGKLSILDLEHSHREDSNGHIKLSSFESLLTRELSFKPKSFVTPSSSTHSTLEGDKSKHSNLERKKDERRMFMVLEREQQSIRNTAERRFLDYSRSRMSRYFTLNGLAFVLTAGFIPMEEEEDDIDISLPGQVEERGVEVVDNQVFLSLFTESTPQELFQRRLDQQDYEAALELASKYSLSSDLVYQRRWSHSEVNPESLEETLGKISDRLWVIAECQNRIPNNSKATKLLLQYGLKQCNVPLIKTEANMKNIKWEEEEIFYGLNRLLFLQYIDRLKTYKAINGSNFDSDSFLAFRECQLVDAAVDFAKQENYPALEILFTYHGNATLPYRLYILRNILETTSPNDYKNLLPQLHVGSAETERIIEEESEKEEESKFLGYENPWTQKKWHKKDWSEDSHVMKRLGLDLHSHSLLEKSVREGDTRKIQSILIDWMKKHSFLADEITFANALESNHIKETTKLDFSGKEFEPQYPNESEKLTQWYEERAREIDEKSGQLENSLQLIDLGMQNHVKKLEKVRNGLQSLIVLVYNRLCDLSLREFEELGEFERFSLLIGDSNPSNIIENLQSRARDILKMDEEGKFSESKESYSLLHKFMKSLSAKGTAASLPICTRIIKHSRPSDELEMEDRIIKSHEKLLEIALDCAYSSPRRDQWGVMNELFGYLPIRDPKNRNEKYISLQDRADRFETHLSASEILSRYNLAPPISFYLQLEDASNRKKAKEFMEKMCQQGQLTKTGLSNSEWRDVARSLVSLQSNVFPFVSLRWVYFKFLKSLLKSGNIPLAKEYAPLLAAQENAHKSLSKEEEEEVGTLEGLVVDLAREYFNSSASIGDASMETASQILSVAPTVTPLILEESNLLKGTAILGDFGLQILPVQVRLESEKMKLIERVLRESKRAYKQMNTILRLSSLLVPGNSSTNNQYIQYLVAEAALQNKDYDRCFTACTQLIASTSSTDVSPVATICKALASSPDFKDPAKKREMISYALINCPVEELSDSLAQWNELEKKTLEGRMQLESPTPESILEGAMEEITKMDTKEVPIRMPKHPFFCGASALRRYVSELNSVSERSDRPLERIKLLRNNVSEMRELEELIAPLYVGDRQLTSAILLDQLPKLPSESERIEDVELCLKLLEENAAISEGDVKKSIEEKAEQIKEKMKEAQKSLEKHQMEEKEKEAELRAQQEAEEKARKEAKEKARKEAEEKAQREAEEKAKREAEEKAKREAEEKRKAEEKAKKEAEEKAKQEAEEKARREAEEVARKEAEEKAKRDEEERIQREKEDKEAKEKARKEAEEKAQREAEEKAKREAEEKAKREAEEKRKAEEKAKKEAEEKAKQEAEEKARREAEEVARKEAEEKAKRDEEERIQREKEDKEAKEKARKEAEEKAQREAEEKAEREAEEKERKEAEERRQAEEKVKKEAEEKERKEAEEKLRVEEQARKEEEDKKRKEEDAKKEAEEKAKREEEERERKAQDEESRLRLEEENSKQNESEENQEEIQTESSETEKIEPVEIEHSQQMDDTGERKQNSNNEELENPEDQEPVLVPTKVDEDEKDETKNLESQHKEKLESKEESTAGTEKEELNEPQVPEENEELLEGMCWLIKKVSSLSAQRKHLEAVSLLLRIEGSRLFNGFPTMRLITPSQQTLNSSLQFLHQFLLKSEEYSLEKGKEREEWKEIPQMCRSALELLSKDANLR
eukprot:TRINITY_DN284_c0_g1_i3.p1 TRINITY_DN284_c0_g1~~TRINITY_DN284_c0_g1_i3.p1  ORF type:complete len:2117 (-),score=914.81 TRINITY_DN284_c0_g1_i3:70-5859(-)